MHKYNRLNPPTIDFGYKAIDISPLMCPLMFYGNSVDLTMNDYYYVERKFNLKYIESDYQSEIRNAQD